METIISNLNKSLMLNITLRINVKINSKAQFALTGKFSKYAV